MYKTGRLNLTSNTAATPEARLQFCSQSNWSLSLEWSHICLLLHRALTKRLENLSSFRDQSSALTVSQTMIERDIEAFLKFSQSGQSGECRHFLHGSGLCRGKINEGHIEIMASLYIS